MTGAAPMSRKRKEPAENDEMPYVIAFLLCEKLLNEADGVVSAIRIVDQITGPADAKPEIGDGITFPALHLLAIVKAGDAKGEREIGLRLVTPEPVSHRLGVWPVKFAGAPDSGHVMRLYPVGVIWAGDGQ
jgi:hypothetical protein